MRIRRSTPQRVSSYVAAWKAFCHVAYTCGEKGFFVSYLFRIQALKTCHPTTTCEVKRQLLEILVLFPHRYARRDIHATEKRGWHQQVAFGR